IGVQIETSEYISRKESLDEPHFAPARRLLESDARAEHFVQIGKTLQVTSGKMLALRLRPDAVPGNSGAYRWFRHTMS
ncbi:MAG: hypothetical protein AAF491_07410, partial [Verrucomicrobiota bacterium]